MQQQTMRVKLLKYRNLCIIIIIEHAVVKSHLIKQMNGVCIVCVCVGFSILEGLFVIVCCICQKHIKYSVFSARGIGFAFFSTYLLLFAVFLESSDQKYKE